MPKYAIFYTGEVRTMETTINAFVKNVLLNEDYHVHAILQSNNTEYHEKLIKNKFGNHLKTLLWFDKNDSTWLELREKLLESPKGYITDYWKNFLRNNGPMIEYYQIYLTYKEMEKYEIENGIKYDMVIRYRPDFMIKDPMDFSLIQNIDVDTIKNIISKIKQEKQIKNVISVDMLKMFMNVFLCQKRIFYKELNINTTLANSEEFLNLINSTDENNFYENVQKYIVAFNYIISYRKNHIYVINRKYMDSIHLLGINYCQYSYPLGVFNKGDDYWFNAENQFRNIIKLNDLDIFDSITDLEEQALYHYNYQNYFYCREGENDDFSYFLKRE